MVLKFDHQYMRKGLGGLVKQEGRQHMRYMATKEVNCQNMVSKSIAATVKKLGTT